MSEPSLAKQPIKTRGHVIKTVMLECKWGYCGEEPSEFFSGPDGMWDLRTVLVAFLYAWREYLSNIVVHCTTREFDIHLRWFLRVGCLFAMRLLWTDGLWFVTGGLIMKRVLVSKAGRLLMRGFVFTTKLTT
eukprot:3145448-Amphidinium_carterae.1